MANLKHTLKSWLRNPISMLTFHIFGRIDMVHADRRYFVNRTLKGKSVYGPGVAFVTGDIALDGCKLWNCDYFIVPHNTHLCSAHELKDFQAVNCHFNSVTFVMPPECEGVVRRAMEKESNVELIYPHAVPVRVS